MNNQLIKNDVYKENGVNKKKLIGIIGLLLVGIILLRGIFYISNKSSNKESILLINKVTLIQGDILNLENIVKYNINDYKFYIDDKNIININNSKLEALSNGDAFVEVIYGNKNEEFSVNVVGIHDYIQVKKIILNKEKIELSLNSKKILEYEIVPENASNKVVSWYSSNEDVVKVFNGEVTPVGIGIAVVSVVSQDGNIDFCTVIVNDNKLEENENNVSENDELKSISFTDKNVVLKKGEFLLLNYSLEPSNVDTKLVWHSSDRKIVDVNSDGKITAISEGKAIITVSSITGLTASINVEVPFINPSDLQLNVNKINLVKGDTFLLSGVVLPNDASDKTIKWSSINNEVVSVSKNGKVKALNNGDTIIEASTINGIKRMINVSVVSKEILVEKVKLSANKNVIDVNESMQINTILIPDNATNNKLLWKSSDNNIVKVNENGLVTGVTAGSALISVVTENGKSSNISITVKKEEVEVEEVVVDKKEITMTVGDTYKLNPTVLPINANNKNVTCSVTYSSKSEGVVSVTNDCLIKAKTGGAATITLKSNNNKTTKVVVTVKNYNLILDKDFLVTSGKNIVKSSNNKVVQLRGYNMGAWLSRSFAMMPINNLPESAYNGDGYSCINSVAFYEILQDNPNVKTKSNAQKLSRILYENTINDTDWDLIAQTGANVVRLPFEYNLFNLEGEEYALSILKKAVSEANERGIYVIIDLHVAPGRQNGGGYCSNYTFLDDSATGRANREKVINIWIKIAETFKNNPGVAGYDLLNEPQFKTGKKQILFDYYDAAYDAIRKVEGTKNHIIFMEETCVFCGYEYGDNPDTIGLLPNPSVYGWKNVVYSNHDYFYKKSDSCPNNVDINTSGFAMINRAKQKIEKIKNKRDSYNIPYYVGEFSMLGSVKNESDSCPYQYTLYQGHMINWTELMKLYDTYGLSYTAWNYKASWDKYYGLVYYGTMGAKADLLNDSYSTLENKFKMSSSSRHNFNSDFYGLFIKQFGGRVASKITFEDSNIILRKNESKIINYTISPNTTINKNVKWSSNNEKVVKVDANTGKMTAVGIGDAKITVTWNPLIYNGPITSGMNINNTNYKKTATIVVKVREEIS